MPGDQKCCFGPYEFRIMLPITTFRKLFTEHFPTEDAALNGIIFVPVADREGWLKKLAQELDKQRRVTCFVSRRNKKVPESVYLGLQIAGLADSRNSGDYLNLQFENRDNSYGLWLVERSPRKSTTVRPVGAVTNPDQVTNLVVEVLALQERNNLRNKRRDKMANLKQTGLTGRLRKLGREHNFSFAIGQNKRDVNLSIRIRGRKRGFHFTFPKGKLDAMLETLPDLVAMLERLQGLGIAFHKNTKRWETKVGEWIEPKSAPDRDEEPDGSP